MLRKIVVWGGLSAVLLAAAFPPWNFPWLSWVAFVPLFFALAGERSLRAFIISYSAGAFFFLATIYWLIHVTLPGMIGVVLYLALYNGVFGLIILRDLRNGGILSLVTVPAWWVVIEWVRAHALTGFPWVMLGHAEAPLLPAIQIADITGVYGVSFLVMLVNVAIFIVLKRLRTPVKTIAPLAIACLCLILACSYGIYRLKNIFTGETIRVAVVQGNIPQKQKWDATFREEILARYERLTRVAAREPVDLIVWPETSVPGFLEDEPELHDRVLNLARSVQTNLLIGTPRAIETDDGLRYYNSTVLINGEGRICAAYNKIHLVPFGEYLPAPAIFSFVHRFAPSPIGDFSAGTTHTVFHFPVERSARDANLSWRMVKKVRFSCLICFEDIFPELTRNMVKQGALFVINMTNDAWFNDTAAPYQHAIASVFRAVENRIPVVRAANTGVSCFIDQCGRITRAVEVNSRRTFVEGTAADTIVLAQTRTFYGRYGDLFAYGCMWLCCGALIGRFYARRR